MVGGLDRFRDHFLSFTDRYVLIGGAACDLIMDAAGLAFRATKDLDIVLTIEAVDAEFQRSFWEFVTAGRYQIRETMSGRPQYFRFLRPESTGYPVMLELFSRVPDAVVVAEGSHLTPIPGDAEVSSLSAILLDDDYYAWIQAGRREIDRVSVVGPEHLVPLKARAWLDLTARREAGATVDGRDIKKHRNDVFRLYQVIDPELVIEPSAPIIRDMHAFLDRMSREQIDLGALGLKTTTLGRVIAELSEFYGID